MSVHKKMKAKAEAESRAKAKAQAGVIPAEPQSKAVFVESQTKAKADSAESQTKAQAQAKVIPAEPQSKADSVESQTKAKVIPAEPQSKADSVESQTKAQAKAQVNSVKLDWVKSSESLTAAVKNIEAFALSVVRELDRLSSRLDTIEKELEDFDEQLDDGSDDSLADIPEEQPVKIYSYRTRDGKTKKTKSFREASRDAVDRDSIVTYLAFDEPDYDYPEWE